MSAAQVLRAFEGRLTQNDQIFTPPAVAAWLVAQADRGGICLDPAAGTGRLLLAALASRVARGQDPVEALERDLIGVELDPIAAAIARTALIARAMALGADRRPAPRLLTGDAFCDLPNRVDAVLMNPPYGSADALSETFHARVGDRWPFHRRQVDRAVFFIAAGLDALAPGGTIAAIVPRYWLEATGAADFRGWLTERAAIRRVLDLGNHQIWPGVEVLTALVVLERGPQGKPARFWRAPASRDALDGALDKPDREPSGAYPVQNLGRAVWDARPPAVEARMARLGAAGSSAGDWFQIGQGFKTGCNRVFVLPRAEAERRGLPPRFLHPTIKARQIRAGRIEAGDKVLLRLLAIDTPEAHPALMDWLESHRDALEARYQVRNGTARWTDLSLPQNLPLMGRTPKILVPLYAREGHFAVDRTGFDVCTDIYLMVPSRPLPIPIESVAALLGSAPCKDWINARAKLKRDGYREFGKRLLSSLPLPFGKDGALHKGPWGALAEAAGKLDTDGGAGLWREIDAVAEALYEAAGRG